MFRLDCEAAKELAAELSQYGPGPGKELEQGTTPDSLSSFCERVFRTLVSVAGEEMLGSAERVDWFQNWLERLRLILAFEEFCVCLFSPMEQGQAPRVQLEGWEREATLKAGVRCTQS